MTPGSLLQWSESSPRAETLSNLHFYLEHLPQCLAQSCSTEACHTQLNCGLEHVGDLGKITELSSGTGLEPRALTHSFCTGVTAGSFLEGPI